MVQEWFGLVQEWFGLVQVWFSMVWFSKAGTDPSDYGFRYGLVQEWLSMAWFSKAGTDTSDYWFRNGLVWFGLVWLVQILLTMSSGMVWFSSGKV